MPRVRRLMPRGGGGLSSSSSSSTTSSSNTHKSSVDSDGEFICHSEDDDESDQAHQDDDSVQHCGEPRPRVEDAVLRPSEERDALGLINELTGYPAEDPSAAAAAAAAALSPPSVAAIGCDRPSVCRCACGVCYWVGDRKGWWSSTCRVKLNPGLEGGGVYEMR